MAMGRMDNSVATIAVDQAASLRRLVGGPGGRAVALTGGSRTGVTSLALNLASALAAQDRRVLLLDEDDSRHNAVHRLQLRQRFAFEHVAGRDVRLDELLLAAPGFELMPLKLSLAQAGHLPPGRAEQLADEYDSLIARIDWVLVDARPVVEGSAPGLALAADDVVVVITPSGESITDAYASIKRLHTEFGRRQFWVLANRVRTLETAMALFQRVKEVAGRYLDVRLKLVGFVPEDEQLARADQLGQPVAQAFPQAEAVEAFTQLASVMQHWPRRAHSADRANLLYRALDVSRRLASLR
ncbi:flagellar biosynthesis protein FlhG [Chitinimonas taiwanensis DSM 18899]|jgi:flagellar biosynthesis protein FlhG|uniref:Flagellar biosynthesis protein FlhG n=2 Tax=Chitinimonas TaxID=240411 RepID=A0A1K2HB62_9NEIS|nr:flagellar biosynthesis protein FlhG [Chitinimonas taiwanensis DSM 18899]